MVDQFPFERFDRFQEELQNKVLSLEILPEEYSILIGRIIGYFAAIELLVPMEVCRISGMSEPEADGIIGLLRSFKLKLDLLGKLVRLVPEGPLAEVASHVKGQFKVANNTRNEYAHAQFRWREVAYLAPYGKNEEEYLLPIEKVRSDLELMRHIEVELTAIVRHNSLPPKLYDRLLRQFPQPTDRA